jgi:SAM-dependent methyltransferase
VDRQWIFDVPVSRDYTGVRQSFVREFLETVRQQTELASALDLGCGVGDFSKFLSDMGLSVAAVDGREENAIEARRRYPEIKFITGNAEDLPVHTMGTFDLVLCVGLLYHLENPFRAIRNFHSLTEKVLLIETMYVPGSEPTMSLLDEGVCEDQGLNYVAFYPSESCVVKMLHRAGFPFVYRFQQLPADPLFTATIWRKRVRTLLAASKIALKAPNLVSAPEPMRPSAALDPWITRWSRYRDLCRAKLFPLRVLAARLLTPLRRRRASVQPDDVETK